MPDIWFPKAVRYPVGNPGTLTKSATKRCTLHTTENDPTKTTAMRVCEWMKREKPGSVYHIIYHPISGETVQMLPVSGSAKSLSNTKGGVETNRIGTVHIQISVVAQAANPFTKYPMPGWSEIVDWITAWGVPRRWVGAPPMGKLDHVNSAFWEKTSGWYGHCCVPENSHHDPGAINLEKVLGVGITPPTKPPVTPPTTPTDTFQLVFDGGGSMTLRMIKPANPDMSGTDVKSWQRLLADRGYAPGAIDGIYGSGSESACRKFQQAKGLTADGIIGPGTGERLLEG